MFLRDDQLYVKQLEEFSISYGFDLDDKQIRLLLQHLELLIEKNKVLNLTRITDIDSALILHVFDSLLFARSVSSVGMSPASRFLDLGTGGGFPGIPLCIATGMPGVLLDSVGKKIKAVNEFVDELGLTSLLDCCSLRAEDLARKQADSFDIVVARAVAKLNVLVEYAAPLLRQGGTLFSSKANISEDEISAALHTAKVCGLGFVSRETAELPNGKGHREIFLFEKISKPSIQLPRQNGMANHKPL